MSKKTDIVAISHSFLRKINTSLYKILKDEYKISIFLISPKSHKDNKKIIQPDYKNENLDVEIKFKKTLFNNLRFKIYRDLFSTIQKKKPNYLLLDFDLISLQSILLLLYSYNSAVKICYFSNENF